MYDRSLVSTGLGGRFNYVTGWREFGVCCKNDGHEDSTTTLRYYAQFIQQTGVKHGSLSEEDIRSK